MTQTNGKQLKSSWKTVEKNGIIYFMMGSLLVERSIGHFNVIFVRAQQVLLQVSVTLRKPGTKLEHQGIKIEFIGQIGEGFD